MEKSVPQCSALGPRLDKQNQCVTKGKNQRCLFDKKEESARGMMKSKNKPVSEEEGPTPNSSKQGKLTQHYILRHVKSSLTGIGGVKIKQLNVN